MWRAKVSRSLLAIPIDTFDMTFRCRLSQTAPISASPFSFSSRVFLKISMKKPSEYLYMFETRGKSLSSKKMSAPTIDN